MKNFLNDKLTRLITPERPLFWGKIWMCVVSVLCLVSAVFGIYTNVGTGTVIASLVTGLCHVAGAVYLIIGRKKFWPDTIARIVLCVCAFCEGCYALSILTDIICVGGTAISRASIVDMIVGLLACAMYIYMFAYYFLNKGYPNYTTPNRTRGIIVGLMVVMGTILTANAIIDVAARKPFDATTAIGAVVAAIASVFVMYVPWFLVVASDQYPDAEISSRAARRAEEKQARKERRQEMKDMWAAAKYARTGKKPASRAPAGSLAGRRLPVHRDRHRK